jgi:hypothetical protein
MLEGKAAIEKASGALRYKVSIPELLAEDDDGMSMQRVRVVYRDPVQKLSIRTSKQSFRKRFDLNPLEELSEMRTKCEVQGASLVAMQYRPEKTHPLTDFSEEH